MSESFTSISAEEAESRIVVICAENPTKLDLVTATSSEFFSVKWRTCFEALQELRVEYEDGIDPLIVFDRVKDRVKGIRLPDLINVDANPAMIASYSDIVREEASKRRLRLGLHRAISSIAEGATAEEAMATAASAIKDAAIEDRGNARGIGDIVRDNILDLIDKAERKAKGEVCVTGIPTGIEKLDLMGMLKPEIVTLVAARPGMGKTALLLTLANGANRGGAGVHVINLEDGEASYARRTISLGSGVDTTDMTALSLTRSHMASMMQMAENARKRTGWIVDSTAGKTASGIVRDVRMQAVKNNTKVVIVDYIQLVKGETEAGRRDKKTRLAEAMTIFAEAAKRDGMAYVIGSQLNRDCEKREDKRPLPTDTSGCGELEEMSKAILMIYRPAVYGDRYAKDQYRGSERPGQRTGELIPESVMELLVRKNNDGLTGTVLCDWRPEKMRIQ